MPNQPTRRGSKVAAATVGVERRAVSLPPDLMLRADTALFELRRRKKRVSFSGLVEVALRELLDQRDLGEILERRGASARRRS